MLEFDSIFTHQCRRNFSGMRLTLVPDFLSIEDLTLLGEAARILARIRDAALPQGTASEAASLCLTSLQIILDEVTRDSPPDMLDGWL